MVYEMSSASSRSSTFGEAPMVLEVPLAKKCHHGLRLHQPLTSSFSIELSTSRDPITLRCELPRDRQRAELVYDYDVLTTGHFANDRRLISDINDRPDSDIKLLDAFKESPATIRPGQSRGLHAAIASIEDVDHDIAAAGLYRAAVTIRTIAARLAPTWHHPISDLADVAHHLAAPTNPTP